MYRYIVGSLLSVVVILELDIMYENTLSLVI